MAEYSNYSRKILDKLRALGSTAPYEQSNETGLYSVDPENASLQDLESAYEADRLLKAQNPSVAQRMQGQVPALPESSVMDRLSGILGKAPQKGSALFGLLGSGTMFSGQAIPGQLPEEKPKSPSQAQTQITKSVIPETPELPMSVLDVGTGRVGGQDALRKAQELSAQGRLQAGLSKGLDILGAGIAGAKPVGQELFTEQAKEAGRPVEQLEQQMQMEKHDPNSPASKAFREYAKRFGIDIKGDFTAAEGEKILPFIFKEFEAKESRKARKEELAMRLREINERMRQAREDKDTLRNLKHEEKEEQLTTKRFDELGKRLTSEVASSRSAFGRGSNNIRAAEAIERLVQGRNLKDLDVREIQEVARSLDALLAQGQPTISGTEHLIPKTARGDLAKTLEYITNTRKGAQSESFLKQMLKTVGREKELAKEQIKRAQGKILGPYEDLQQKDPNKWDTLLRVHDLPIDVLSKKESSKETDKKDPKVQGYADQYFQGDYNKALELLRKRGYGG